MGILQYPFFVRWGWGCIRICFHITHFGAFFGGCERCFGFSWVICRLGGKFGSQSILRLQNRWRVFVVGLGFPVWGFGGVLVGC